MTIDRSLDLARLRELLRYEGSTGELIWRVDRRRADGSGYIFARAGSIAGHVRKDGYRRVRVCDREYRAHRLVWLLVFGAEPDGEIDHINRSRADNRLCNLRLATASQNSGNAGRRKDNSSGCKGVFWDTRDRSWRATITKGGRRHSLGYYASREAAHAVYIAAAEKLFGEFACAG